MGKAERARFLSEGEESKALIRVAFDTLGQKQRVLEPCSLSLSSMVAASIFLKTFVLNIASSYHGNGDAYIREDGILRYFDYFYFILLTFFVFLITI